jgi:hypothetical protein
MGVKHSHTQAKRRMFQIGARTFVGAGRRFLLLTHGDTD